MPSSEFERLSRDAAFQEMFRGGHRRHVGKGQIVLREGDQPRSLYFLMSGSVSVQLLNWLGHEALLALMYSTFIELSRKHPSLWLELAGQIAARLRSVNRRMAEMPKLQARDRVWLIVAELADKVGAGTVDARKRA